MIIGDTEISTCADCPGYEWAGENISTGDQGYYCAFNSGTDCSEDSIPEDCPIRPCHNQEKEQKDKEHEYCKYCLCKTVFVIPDDWWCHLQKEPTTDCPHKKYYEQ